MGANDKRRATSTGHRNHDSTSVPSSAKTSATSKHETDKPPLEDKSNRNPVEVLADEFSERLRAGQSPTIDEYVALCPEHEKEIRLIFPSIESVEKISTEEAVQRKNERDATRFFQAKMDEISDFEIIRELGRGGMGIVYEAIQKSLNRKVALKTINPLIANSPQQLKRFQREAEAAAKLQHTNIIQIFGVGEENGIHYFAMQLVEGCSLAHLIGDITLDNTARIPLTVTSGNSTSTTDSTEAPSTDDIEKSEFRELSYPDYINWVCQIIRDVASALDYAHSNGVYHRDIKPANLLIDKNGTVLISDFGLAKFSDFDELTQAGDLVGTLRYMAPEQFEGVIDQRTDIYSLGLALYELLALKPAFEGTKKTNAITISEKKLTVPRLRSIDSRIPVDLETITAKATAPDPVHRFQSAGELQDEIQRFLNGESIKSRPVTWIENVWRWSKRNPAIASLSAVSILLLITVAIVGFVGNWQTRKALAGMESEYHRAEDQKVRAHENLSIAKVAIKQLLNNLSQRGVFQQKSYRFGEEEFVGTSARLSEADIDMLNILLDVFQQFSNANEEDFALDTAEANSTIGDIYQKLGRYEDAVQSYSTAFEQYSDFNQSEASGDTLLAQLKILNEMAVAAGLSGDRKTAERSYHTANQFYERHENQLKTQEGKFEYARTLNVFASTGSRVNQFAFNFPRRRPPNIGFPHTPRFSPGRWPGFGDPGDKQHRFEQDRNEKFREGKSRYGQTRESRRGKGRGGKGSRFGSNWPYGKEPGNGKERKNGTPFEKSKFGGERPGPNSYLQYAKANKKAESILNELIDSDPDNPRYQLALARNLSDRMRLIRFGRSSNEFGQALSQVKSTLNQLIEDNPEIPLFQFELAETLMNNLYSSSSEAKKHIQEAVRISKKLSQQFPDVYEYRAQYADAIAKEASINERNPSERNKANEAFQRVLKIYDEITKAQPDAHQFQLSYVLHLCKYADMLDKQRMESVADENRKTALTILNKVGITANSVSPANRIKSELERKIARTPQPKRPR